MEAMRVLVEAVKELVDAFLYILLIEVIRVFEEAVRVL
jgi:hypothetical protein